MFTFGDVGVEFGQSAEGASRIVSVEEVDVNVGCGSSLTFHFLRQPQNDARRRLLAGIELTTQTSPEH